MSRSRTFKIIHTFYLLVIAVLLTLLFVERQGGQPEEPGNSALSEQLTSVEDSLRNHVNDLSQNIDSRFAALEERLPQPADEPQAPRTAPPSSLQNPPVNRVSESQNSSQPQAEQPMNSRDYARLGSAMTDDFDARKTEYDIQSVDPDWAEPTTALIRAQFNENEYLQQLDLAKIECRSSICQVNIDVSEPASINPARLLQALHGINENEEGLAYQVISRPLDATYRVLIMRSNEPDGEP